MSVPRWRDVQAGPLAGSRCRERSRKSPSGSNSAPSIVVAGRRSIGHNAGVIGLTRMEMCCQGVTAPRQQGTRMVTCHCQLSVRGQLRSGQAVPRHHPGQRRWPPWHHVHRKARDADGVSVQTTGPYEAKVAGDSWLVIGPEGHEPATAAEFGQFATGLIEGESFAQGFGALDEPFDEDAGLGIAQMPANMPYRVAMPQQTLVQIMA